MLLDVKLRLPFLTHDRNNFKSKSESRTPVSCDECLLVYRRGLSQNLWNDLSFHVGQSTLNAVMFEAQSFEIKAQEMEDGCVEMV